MRISWSIGFVGQEVRSRKLFVERDIEMREIRVDTRTVEVATSISLRFVLYGRDVSEV